MHGNRSIPMGGHATIDNSVPGMRKSAVVGNWVNDKEERKLNATPDLRDEQKNANSINHSTADNRFNQNRPVSELGQKRQREAETIDISVLYINQFDTNQFNLYEFQPSKNSKIEHIFSQIAEIQQTANMKVWKLHQGKHFQDVHDSFNQGSYDLYYAYRIDYRRTFLNENIRNGDKLVVAVNDNKSVQKFISSNPASNRFASHSQHAEKNQVSPQKLSSYSHYPERYQGSYQWGVKGIRNIGNACYMNSVLQCLYSSTKLTQYLETKDSQGPLFFAYRRFVEEMRRDQSHFVSPDEIKRTIERHYTSQFRGYGQHDSHDFLSAFIEAMNKEAQGFRTDPSETGELPKGLSDPQLKQLSWDMFKFSNPDEFADLFHGQFLNKIVCDRCKQEQSFSDNFSSISVPLVSNDGTVTTNEGSLGSSSRPVASNSRLECTFFFVPLDHSKDIRAITYNIQQTRYLNPTEIKSQAKSMFKFQSVLIAEIKDNRYHREIQSYIELERDMKIAVYETENSRRNRMIILEFTSGNEFQGIPRLMFLSKDMRMDKVCLEIFQYANTVFHIRDRNSKNVAQEFMRSYHNQSKIKFQYKNCYKTASPLPIDSYYSLESVNSSESNLSVKVRNTEYPLRNTGEPIIAPAAVPSHTEPVRHSENRLNLSDCFAYLCREEKISRENSFDCPKCRRQNPTTKTLRISTIPECLVINLKRSHANYSRTYQYPYAYRSAYSSGSSYSVDQRVEVDFPIENLDLSRFVVENRSQLYDLHAIVCYSGSSYSGHYISYAKHFGEWYCFNDSIVKPVSNIEREVDKKSVHILFYQKKSR